MVSASLRANSTSLMVNPVDCWDLHSPNLTQIPLHQLKLRLTWKLPIRVVPCLNRTVRVFPGESSSLYNQTLMPPLTSQLLGMVNVGADFSVSVEAPAACHFKDFCPCLTVFCSVDNVKVSGGAD